jgi:hypothetical protein
MTKLEKDLAKLIVDANKEFQRIVGVLLAEDMTTSAYYFNKASLGERILNDLLEAVESILNDLLEADEEDQQ